MSNPDIDELSSMFEGMFNNDVDRGGGGGGGGGGPVRVIRRPITQEEEEEEDVEPEDTLAAIDNIFNIIMSERNSEPQQPQQPQQTVQFDKDFEQLVSELTNVTKTIDISQFPVSSSAQRVEDEMSFTPVGFPYSLPREVLKKQKTERPRDALGRFRSKLKSGANVLVKKVGGFVNGVWFGTPTWARDSISIGLVGGLMSSGGLSKNVIYVTAPLTVQVLNSLPWGSLVTGKAGRADVVNTVIGVTGTALSLSVSSASGAYYGEFVGMVIGQVSGKTFQGIMTGFLLTTEEADRAARIIDGSFKQAIPMTPPTRTTWKQRMQIWLSPSNYISTLGIAAVSSLAVTMAVLSPDLFEHGMGAIGAEAVNWGRKVISNPGARGRLAELMYRKVASGKMFAFVAVRLLPWERINRLVTRIVDKLTEMSGLKKVDDAVQARLRNYVRQSVLHEISLVILSRRIAQAMVGVQLNFFSRRLALTAAETVKKWDSVHDAMVDVAAGTQATARAMQEGVAALRDQTFATQQALNAALTKVFGSAIESGIDATRQSQVNRELNDVALNEANRVTADQYAAMSPTQKQLSDAANLAELNRQADMLDGVREVMAERLGTTPVPSLSEEQRMIKLLQEKTQTIMEQRPEMIQQLIYEREFTPKERAFLDGLGCLNGVAYTMALASTPFLAADRLAKIASTMKTLNSVMSTVENVVSIGSLYTVADIDNSESTVRRSAAKAFAIADDIIWESRNTFDQTTMTPEEIANNALGRANIIGEVAPWQLSSRDLALGAYGLHPEMTRLETIGGASFGRTINEEIGKITQPVFDAIGRDEFVI